MFKCLQKYLATCDDALCTLPVPDYSHVFKNLINAVRKDKMFKIVGEYIFSPALIVCVIILFSHTFSEDGESKPIYFDAKSCNLYNTKTEFTHLKFVLVLRFLIILTCRVKLDIKVRDTQNVDSAKRLAGSQTSSILLSVASCIHFITYFI